jgi:hypothetical protein
MPIKPKSEEQHKYFHCPEVFDKKRSIHKITMLPYLNRIVIRTEGKVIPTTQRRVFRSHMHFQVLEEVLVLM